MLGAKVALLEQSGQIGGTVAQALIHTLGGFFDDQGGILNPGLPEELIERLTNASPLTCKRRIGKTWNLSVDPKLYQHIVAGWIGEYPAIQVCCRTTVNHVSANNNRIDGVEMIDHGKPRLLRPYALVDTTGHASVVRGIAAHLVSEGGALAGLIVQLRGVGPGAVQFPKGIALLRNIRKAAETGELPLECASLWLDGGVYPNEVYIKFNLLEADYAAVPMAAVAGRLLCFLRALPEFSNAFINAIGQLGVRDGGRVRGEYTLTESDIRQGRRFDDAVCQGCWPIEHWHPQRGVCLDYFPPGHRYQIPRRALQVQAWDNLFVAGKCFSAEPLAQASARVVGSCWAMGEGLAKSLLGKLTDAV